jgi:sulfate permease, SulP family
VDATWPAGVAKVPPLVRGARLRYNRGMIPGLDMLRGYRRAWLPGDLLAGVTVAAYLVPQVMAYATIAGLPRSPACGPRSRP